MLFISYANISHSIKFATINRPIYKYIYYIVYRSCCDNLALFIMISQYSTYQANNSKWNWNTQNKIKGFIVSRKEAAGL